MKFALIDDIKQEAMPGMQGVCPVCGAQCIAKCGERNRHHWAHKSKKNCDHWWEIETAWHRNWKDKFPKEWQEVIDYDLETGEKHVADVRTDTGLVIEFQHSAIKPEEQKAREKFHKAMIWVVNVVGKREKKLFDEYPKNPNEIFLRYELDIPQKWYSSKVPVLFDLDNLDDGMSTDSLYCMLPQAIGYWRKRFLIITKQDFVHKANNGELKDFLHKLMREAKIEADKRKKHDSLCDEIDKNIRELQIYSESYSGQTKAYNICVAKNTKGWKKIEGQWYIPSGVNSLLKVDAYQGCEYKQDFPVCDASVKSLIDYYNKIVGTKCLMYNGRAYNGELCSGYAVAKYLTREQDLLFVVCKELKGAFVKKGYERDYGYYSGNTVYEWLRCPHVQYSYNLITIELKDGKFIHSHEFELANWMVVHEYDVLI